MLPLHNEWDEILAAEFAQPYYLQLCAFLRGEYATTTIYPPAAAVFNALRLTPYNAVKAVILGQDPYHGAGQAQGLCFSVPDNVPPPPSLQNIFKELRHDLGEENFRPTQNGNLTSWAENGVLLLNTVLTVRAGQANSHQHRGWEIFTDEIIRRLNARAKPLAFILWGTKAINKRQLITAPQHAIFTAPHPSPLSAHRGFFGCRHFSQTNEFLRQQGLEPIAWQRH